MFNNLQAVILAAGKGERMHPLTLQKPKPLLKVFNKTILEHNLEQLNNLVKEVILVIGYKGEMFRNLIGSRYKNLKITYVVQKRQLGTGDAAKTALPFIKNDKFILMAGDDLYHKDDIKECTRILPCILLKEAEEPSNFGVVTIEKNFVKDIIEKPKKPTTNLVNTGFYFLDKSIFSEKIKKSSRQEYEFTDFIKKLATKKKLYFKIAKNWIPITFPWSLLEANEFLLNGITLRQYQDKKEKIEKNSRIVGPVVIEKGTILKSGSYIKGPVYIGKNCQIGPNCYIRDFATIGNNCYIGQGVEIKNAIIGDNSNILHLSYVGDSIIGDNCNLGAGTIIANVRHDMASVKSIVKGKLIDTKKEKFGCVLGDEAKTGIGTLIYPGRKIWSGRTTLPGQIVSKDIT